MFQRIRFPWLYVIEAVLWPALLAGFVCTTAFVGAEPIASLNLQGKSLPAGWEAAIYSHGSYLQGYLIGSRPFLFAAALLLMVGAATLLVRVQKAQVRQRELDGPARAKVHRLSQALVFAFVVALGYILLTRVLVGIAPA